MIQAFGLTSNPRKAHPPAVDDVTFEARAGRVTALLGPAGAGKTTALRLMLELQQGRGLTYFRGRPLHRIAHPSYEVGVVLGDVPGHPSRSVRGHLRMLCAATGVPARRADEVLEAVGLVGLREERLGTLSRGMDRRLGLACALLPDPHTLVLDEPAHGLSTREARWVHAMLRAHAAQGGTVLFTTAESKEAARVADRVVTLESGRLVADQEVIEFARTRLRPRVAVRSPHAARLAALLVQEARAGQRSVEVVQEGGNRLSVYGSTTAEVGESAFRNGILVHQLADETGDMGPSAGPEPLTGERPEAVRRQRIEAEDEPIAADGNRTAYDRRDADDVPATDRWAAPGADRREESGSTPVTPQPRAAVPPRPGSQSRISTEREPGPGHSSTDPEPSVTTEPQPPASAGALADGRTATPESSHVDPPTHACPAEPQAVALSARPRTAFAGIRPTAPAPSAPRQTPAASPEPSARMTSTEPVSATVPAQPPASTSSAQSPATAVSSQPQTAAASLQPPAATASRESSAAASAQPQTAVASGRPAATAASAQPAAVVASSRPQTVTTPAQSPALATSAQPPVPGRPVSGALATPAASLQPPTHAVPVETSPAESSTAQRPAGQPRPQPKPQPHKPPTAPDAPAPSAAGHARRPEDPTPDASSSLPPPISVRSAPSPLRPLRYELRRAAGIGAGFVICGVVLLVSAVTAVLLARLGHTPQARLFAAWPRELPLPPAALGAGLLGALAFGDEFRHPALAADRGTVPRRLGLLTAKLLVSGATAVLLSFLTMGCDAEVLYLVYGREFAQVPADWLSLTAGWFGLVAGCAWAGVLAAGVFRSTTAGLAAVLAVPVLVVPVVHKALQGPGVRMTAGLPVRLREVFLLRWPFGGERYLVGAVRVLAQPVGGALALSLTALLCAYLFTTLRARGR
ncbi:ABC-type multidrug transport system ATPase subunit [Streptomyces sp. Ag109_O5-1]|uniref:ABC transporter ATP-binding protein n=1 Tax=Streptomyces sp. Ag109_O5-1 TaxID=1938851 RepID=UPI000FBD789A|nr:ABC transporter ATP-binding protein [Streptomyces sp. Ag109_O5-1]RPE40061.1 ABC-type multidrug transport system ATPase subunit [Streptomyces sp. Ag109_O5-1]